MARSLIECVPNFSEGRDSRVVDAIANAVAETSAVALLGRTMDPDHHRSVITFAGDPPSVAEAAFRAVRQAVRLIDLNVHRGVHPRLGAADVVPFVPLEHVTLEQCATIAVAVGERLWNELGVPVYLYEGAARRGDRARLENIRRGGFEIVREQVLTDPERRPDIGGPELHPTAGACIVGARRFLIAWNVVLGTADIEPAKRIARAIRESSGGLPHVKALGLQLPSRRLVQVSINLTDFERMPLPVVYQQIRRLAELEGAPLLEAELVGLLPRAAAEQIAGTALRFVNFTPELVLEERVAALLK
ncbi:MAG TPA: glutamate formimidoyltransferase [Bryobacteraceae bacterium]|nr:glutamate formimidoyltransferase [Bryobacteraceae bacterium]